MEFETPEIPDVFIAAAKDVGFPEDEVIELVRSIERVAALVALVEGMPDPCEFRFTRSRVRRMMKRLMERDDWEPYREGRTKNRS